MITTTSDSIGKRLAQLERALQADKLAFFGEVLDMENSFHRNSSCVIVSEVVFPDTIKIEEFARNYYILDPDISEKTWLDSISVKTGLDCRMIIGFKPITHVGLHRLRVLVNSVDNQPKIYVMQIWVLPLEG